MKIREIKVIPLSYEIDDKPARKRFFALVKVTTDDGIVGWGEASDCYGHHLAMTVKAYVEEQLQWWFLDRDPRDVESLVDGVRQQIYRYHGNRELVIQALSAVEIALWDIRGKVLGKPICELLGKYRERIPIYAADRPAFFVSAEGRMEWLGPLLDKGVSTIKIRIGHNFKDDEKFVRAFRKVVSDDIRLFVDGKYNYTPDSAIKMAAVLDEIGVSCFEEPVNDMNLNELARVARASRVPLAYGEHTFTIHGFRDLITSGAAQILNPDATVCGGITTALEAAKLGATFGLALQPHCGGLSAIGIAANLQTAAAMPSLDIIEYDSRAHQPLRDEIIKDSLFAMDRIEDGFLAVPTGPGLGIEIDESVFERYPYELDEKIAREYAFYGTPRI
jgi:D-galactarolactone cycloisomerase